MGSLLAEMAVATTVSAERQAAVIDFRGPELGSAVECEQVVFAFYGTDFVDADRFWMAGYDPRAALNLYYWGFAESSGVICRRIGHHSLVVYGRLEPTGLKRPKVIRFESANPPPGGLPTVYNLPANDT